MEKREVCGLTYYLEYKGVKNINMRVLDDGTISVSAPYGTSRAKIDEIISSRLSWFTRVINRKSHKSEVNNTKGYVVIWGQVYDLVINEGSKRFYLEDGRAYVYCPKVDNESVKRFLDRQLARILSDKVNELREKDDRIILDYHLSLPSEIRYREMTSRWGSCQTRSKVITLNSRLVHYPVECLDYVLLHEYMHLIVPNHSTRFHQLMDYYMPNNKEIRHLLNNYQINYN